MSVKTPDKSLAHLYPPFREKLERVLKETSLNLALGAAGWIVTEGYRSQERQTHLYSLGRTAPGPIVTWKRSPTWHGTGLAADCMPKKLGYDAPRDWWGEFRRVYRKHGLDNPAWENSDLGHCQLTDEKIRAKALVWVRSGFKEPPVVPPPADGISVLVDGHPVPDADAYLEDGRAWVMLRPVADGLDLVIAEVVGQGMWRSALLVDDEGEWPVRVGIKGGRAYVKATDLPAQVLWLGGERLLTITRRGKG